MSPDASEFLFSDSPREASNDVQHFFGLEIYRKTETSCFSEKILYANDLKVLLNVPDLLQEKVLSRS